MPITINAAFNSLDERFKPLVKEILEKLSEKGYDAMVCEGRRTESQQREKVRLGYSTTMKSYHLTGLAADIVDRKKMWNIPVTHQFWIDLGTIVKGIKAPTGTYLRWGGDWNVAGRFEALKAKKKVTWFADVAHVEIHFN